MLRPLIVVHLLLILTTVYGQTPNGPGTPTTQELSDPAADDCISFTRLLGRIKIDYAFQRLLNISDIDCQDKCISVSTCQSFSFGISDNGITECMLSIYTQKSRTGLFNDNGLIQNFAYYEKSREGCMELAFECGPDKILVQGKSTEPFSGLVYPENIYDKSCQTDLHDQKTFTFEIGLQGKCGTRYAGNGLYENVIIIQWDDLIVTRRDRRFKISCQYDLSDLEISHKSMEVGQVLPLEMNLKVPRPDPVIRLINMDSNDVNVARVGDNMVFRVELAKQSPYGIFAKNCKAQGENAAESLDLIDAKGCPIHAEVFPQLQRNGSALETQFLAFRFRKSFQVFYQCTIDYCVDSCPPVDCNGLKSYGRRKREADDDATSNAMHSKDITNTLLIVDDGPTQRLPVVRSITRLNTTALAHQPIDGTCDSSYQLISMALAIVCGSFFLMILALTLFLIISHRRSARRLAPPSKEYIYPQNLFGH